MKRLIKALFHPFKVEHIRFNEVNEYLICYWKILWIERVEVERAIGAPSRNVFTERIERLRSEGATVEEKEMSLEEFDDFSRHHPVLEKDYWVKLRRTAIASGIARR